jgi:hypothetical protein
MTRPFGPSLSTYRRATGANPAASSAGDNLLASSPAYAALFEARRIIARKVDLAARHNNHRRQRQLSGMLSRVESALIAA